MRTWIWKISGHPPAIPASSVIVAPPSCQLQSPAGMLNSFCRGWTKSERRAIEREGSLAAPRAEEPASREESCVDNLKRPGGILTDLMPEICGLQIRRGVLPERHRDGAKTTVERGFEVYSIV